MTNEYKNKNLEKFVARRNCLVKHFRRILIDNLQKTTALSLRFARQNEK